MRAVEAVSPTTSTAPSAPFFQDAPIRDKSVLPYLRGAACQVQGPDDQIPCGFMGSRALMQGDRKLLCLNDRTGLAR